ncbi:MAG: hypothetical protein ACI95C_002359 [Pseudohongiellaceae bacterium]|jgi:hypothetical protein
MAKAYSKTLGLLVLSQLLALQVVLAAEENNPVTELEARLLNAPQVSLAFTIKATGAVEANLEGTLAIRGKETIEFTVTGNFAGEELDMIIMTSATELEFGAKDAPRTIAIPAALRESVLIGLTRMGILHNIARLTGGNPPDHGEGGVQDWVKVSSAIKSPDARSLTFDIVVDGQPAGSAALRLDPFGMVVNRQQTVEFPQGAMEVEEDYFNVQVSF